MRYRPLNLIGFSHLGDKGARIGGICKLSRQLRAPPLPLFLSPLVNVNSTGGEKGNWGKQRRANAGKQVESFFKGENRTGDSDFRERRGRYQLENKPHSLIHFNWRGLRNMTLQILFSNRFPPSFTEINWSETTEEGWNTPKCSLNRWLSLPISNQ